MLRLHDNHLSGNGYKPRLLLAHLGRTYERVEVDILKGETRTPEFLAKNPDGRIPVLELEDGMCIAESNAILFYLAHYPAVSDWLGRVAEQPGHVPMYPAPVGVVERA